MKRKIFLLLTLTSLLTLFGVFNVFADETIQGVDVKSYTELDNRIENETIPYKEIMSIDEQKVFKFTLNKSAHVRIVGAIMNSHLESTRLKFQIKSQSQLKDYTKQDITANKYSNFGGCIADLQPGTYSLIINGTMGSTESLRVYLGILPANTNFLSATYIGETGYTINQGVSTAQIKFKVNNLDKINVLKIHTSNNSYGGTEYTASILGETYTLNTNNEVIIPFVNNQFYVTFYTKDEFGYEHVKQYKVVSPSLSKIEGVKDVYYTGKPVYQNIKFTANKDHASELATYTTKYINNNKIGTASVTFSGYGDWIGSITKTFKIKKDNIKPTVKGVKNKKTYKKKVTIKFSDAQTGVKKATLNGKKIKSGKKIKKKGKYTLKVYDAVGNVKVVRFKIK